MSLLQLLRAKFGAASPPLPPITPVAAPISPGGVLGCGEPRAEIWTRGLTSRVLDLPNITAAEWGRVLADTSQGQVGLSGQSLSADPGCCAVLDTIRPWRHELVIYRDDEFGWSGPITEMAWEGETLVVKARDLSAWLDHRLVHQTHIYGGQGADQGTTDTTIIFADLVTDAMAADTTPNLVLDLGIVAGVLAQGNYTPASFKTVGPLIRDLAKGSIDWYVIDRTLTYTGGGANTPAVGTGIDVTAASIVNPGFDVNTAGWTATGFLWTLTRDTGIFHTTPASGKMTYGVGGSPSPVTLKTTASSLQVGKNYTLSVWFRVTAFLLPASGGGSISIAGVTSTAWTYACETAPGLGTFVQFSVTFTATATSHVATITPGRNVVTWYTDDVQLILNNPDVPPPIPPALQVLDIRLSDDDLAQPARITLSGLDQENRSVVSSQQSGGDVAFYGEAPAPEWTLNTLGPGLTTAQVADGLLESATTSTLADASSATSQATQRNALLTDTPVILEGFVLAASAGVAMSQLVPGVLIGIQLDRPCLSVQQTMLLRQMQVKTTPGGGEQVTLTLEPATGF